MTPRARITARVVVVAGVPALCLAISAAGTSLADASCLSFGTVAAGDGVRIHVNHTGYVADQADAQGPAAQAVANSRGISNGYAGAPYPGDAALSGLAQAGQDPSALPVYVASQFPTDPSNSKSAGTFELVSSSKLSTSSASAKGGGPAGPGASAGASSTTARAGCDDSGGISSTAVTDAEAVSLAGGVLRLGRVHGEAHAKVGSAGRTVLSSNLVVGNATVSGQAVEITDKGVQYPGGAQSLPGNPLADALAAADITVTWLAASKDPDGGGITAPGLRISVARTVSAAQPTVVTYTFGRAYARATTTPGEQPSGGTGGGTGGQTGTGTGATTGGSTGGGLAPGGSSGSTAPTTPGLAPEISDPGTDRGPGPVPASSLGPLQLPMSGLYLALVVAAVAIFAGGYLIRQIGVRLSWT